MNAEFNPNSIISWECSVCLETFFQKTNKVIGKCTHIFHENCMKKCKSCPECRSNWKIRLITDATDVHELYRAMTNLFISKQKKNKDKKIKLLERETEITTLQSRLQIATVCAAAKELEHKTKLANLELEHKIQLTNVEEGYKKKYDVISNLKETQIKTLQRALNEKTEELILKEREFKKHLEKINSTQIDNAIESPKLQQNLKNLTELSIDQVIYPGKASKYILANKTTFSNIVRFECVNKDALFHWAILRKLKSKNINIEISSRFVDETKEFLKQNGFPIKDGIDSDCQYSARLGGIAYYNTTNKEVCIRLSKILLAFNEFEDIEMTNEFWNFS